MRRVRTAATAPTRRTVRAVRAVRAVTALTALAVTAPLLSGCSAGMRAQTSQVRNHPDGSSGVAGDLVLRHVRVESPGYEAVPAGGTVRVFGSLVSRIGSDDELVGASSEAATRAVVRTADGSVGTVPVPADTRVELGPQGPYVELVGLTEELRGGRFVTVTFRFREGGEAELTVPVETATRE